MNVNRALEIIDDPGRIDVSLNGVSVWIDTVDMETGTADVHSENDPTERMKVPVGELKEH